MKVFQTDCKEWEGYKPCCKQKLGITMYGGPLCQHS